MDQGYRAPLRGGGLRWYSRLADGRAPRIQLGVGLAPSTPLALLGCAFAALGGPLTDVIRAFLIQTEFPPDQVGKVYSLRVVVSRASHGVGLLLAAPLFASTDVRTAIGGAGSVVVGVAIAVLFLAARGAAPARR